MRDPELEEIRKQLEILRDDLARKVVSVEKLERKHEEMIAENGRHVKKLLDLEALLVKRLDALDERVVYLESPEESLPPDDRADFRRV
jgi:hypothetical protein